MKNSRKRHVFRKWAGGACALLLAGAAAAGGMHAQAAPEQNELTGVLDTTGLEQLLEYDGEGRLPSTVDPRWNTYLQDAGSAVPYSNLPAAYDLRSDHEDSPVPEIRNQGSWGTCWAFGSIASIESNAAVQGGGSAADIDYSELFQIWSANTLNHGEGMLFESSDPNLKLLMGGTGILTLADTTAWSGPVDESLAPYEEDWCVPEQVQENRPNDDAVHVQDVDKLPETAVFTDWEAHTGYSLDQNAVAAVKNALMENGIVDVSYYAGETLPDEEGGAVLINQEKFAHYCPIWMSANHEVSIVGWDDNYSGENFAVKPTDEDGNVLNGAWIVRNSWGKGDEDNNPWMVDKDGYFYISYYDQSITEFISFQVDVKDSDGNFDYDHNYQYDYLGEKAAVKYFPDPDWTGYSVANVFEAEGYETLEAVSVTTSTPGVETEIEIYRLDDSSMNPEDGTRLLSQTEQIAYSGYHTITLEKEILLNPGDRFAVVQSFSEDAAGWVPLEVGVEQKIDMGDYSLSYIAEAEQGESYLYAVDESGTYCWTDVTDFPSEDTGNGYTANIGNVMIKAFTSDRTPEPDGEVTVEIIHTNDIHGRSGYEEDSVFGFEKLAAYIDSENPDLVIDAGDLYHGQAFATMEQGESMAKLVEAVGYDLLTPGNHDWNYGKERLKELGEMSGLEILAGNITQDGAAFFENDGTYVKEIQDTDGDSVKVGVLGVFDQDIEKDTAPSNVEGLSFANDAETANALAKQLREQGCDIVIAISHQLDCESFLAQTEGIDVLIVGHEHTELTDTEYEDKNGNPVRVVETGAYFENVGNLTLTYDVHNKTISEIDETLVSAQEAANITSDPEVEAILNDIRAGQEEQLTEIVGSTGRDLDGRWEELRIKETGMGRLVTAAYLAETGADVAFENAGGIRIGRILEAGDITWGDVIDTAPFGNYIVTKEISGQDLLEILEQSIEVGRQNKISYDEWKETGENVAWPDNSGSYLQFAGVYVQYDMSKPAGERVVLAQVGDKDLDPAKTYTIATNNFIALGDDYSQLKDAPEINQHGACEEALAAFIGKGQDVVDKATGEQWLTEVQDEHNGAGGGTVSDESTSDDKQDGTGQPEDQKKESADKSVQTGDSQNAAIWIALILLSGAALTGTAVYRKKTGAGRIKK